MPYVLVPRSPTTRSCTDRPDRRGPSSINAKRQSTTTRTTTRTTARTCYVDVTAALVVILLGRRFECQPACRPPESPAPRSRLSPIRCCVRPDKSANPVVPSFQTQDAMMREGFIREGLRARSTWSRGPVLRHEDRPGCVFACSVHLF